MTPRTPIIDKGGRAARRSRQSVNADWWIAGTVAFGKQRDLRESVTRQTSDSVHGAAVVVILAEPGGYRLSGPAVGEVCARTGAYP